MSPIAILVLAFGPLAMAAAEEPTTVRHVDLVHFSHTDYGFTDHPAVCRELQTRFLDIAIDGVLATRDKPPAARFSWTAETTVAVCDWWQAASPARREEFLRAIRSGQLEISALPLNNTPFLGPAQWDTMLHWMPEDLWQKVQPKVAIQNDVNGFPRAGAVKLLDRGVHYLFSGINEDSGGPPCYRPSAFWWKMPDGRKMLVYLNYSYPAGYWFFEPEEWRRGPVPLAGDTRYRPPRAGDYMGAEEAAVGRCHRHLLARLRALQAEGYAHPILTLSITNQWRIDNDPPFLPLADFVATWTRLGLQPTLRLTTASVAMKRLEEEIGARLPVREGEWTDWWANGTASAPREVAASRLAKRLLAAASSPLWGEMSERGRLVAEGLWKDLCLFDEHTWGSSNSVALPYSLDTQGQFNDKASLAYRPMARAEWFLAQRVRSKLAAEDEGFYVANSATLPWSGWVRMPVTALRADYRGLDDVTGGTASRRTPFAFEAGLRPFTPPQNPGEVSPENPAATFPDRAPRQVAKVWIEDLSGRSIRKFRPTTEAAVEPARDAVQAKRPTVAADASGWPAAITWPGMTKPLFTAGLGDFLSVGVRGFAPRWGARDVWSAPDSRRDALRKEKLEPLAATAPGKAEVRDEGHTIVYTQAIRHPRLQWATRQLEVWKRQPRARYTLRLNRTSSESPEALFIVFPLPCEGRMPRTSCGGMPFVPYQDQLPGTCRDYLAIDSWVEYASPEGRWLWVSRDAPLVTFGDQQVLARRSSPPPDTHRILAMIFNNFWYTNFVGDSHGVMEFQFDLAWDKGEAPAAEWAETLLSEPQVLINPGFKEHPIVLERLYKP